MLEKVIVKREDSTYIFSGPDVILHICVCVTSPGSLCVSDSALEPEQVAGSSVGAGPAQGVILIQDPPASDIDGNKTQ